MLTILQGDVVEQLRTLPDESVHCCVTSPPYWGLRDYSTNGQLGLEKTPEEYVEKMVFVFREVRRVLRKDGTLWMNMGDSYANATCGPRDGGTLDQWKNGGRRQPESVPDSPILRESGLKPKDLCGIPWRLAFALQADGWWLRSDIIWAKPNPMPESVTDRPTKAHEYIFLLTKSKDYFYDQEAIKEKGGDGSDRWGGQRMKLDTAKCFGGNDNGQNRPLRTFEYNGSRNKRTVWTVATAPYPEAHFATYPPDLIKPCILAGTSAKGCCAKCGSPWERIVETEGRRGYDWNANNRVGGDRLKVGQSASDSAPIITTKTIGWQPTCKCAELKDEDGYCIGHDITHCTVLDPFAGSGTTGTTALELGRKAILIELNPKYVELIKTRCNVTPGLQLA